MKKLIGAKNLSVTLVVCSLLFTAGSAFAFMAVDGNLNEWGVTPGAWGSSVWTPNAGIGYVVEDYKPGTDGGYVGPGWGGQTFDAEAMYVKSDSNNFYFAIVTGFPKGGALGYIPGDIALDLNKDGLYEYGIGVADRNGTFKKGGLYKAGSSAAWANGIWTSAEPLSDPTYLKSYINEEYFGGINLAYNSDYYSADDHWVIEGYIPLSAFGDDWKNGNEFRAHWAMSCGNDYLYVDYASTPEPATLSLLGLGLIALAGIRRKK